VATLAHPPRSALSLGTVGLAVLCVSQFVDVLSVNTAVIALPDIRADLGMSTAAAQWVISAYALLFGGLLLFGGRLADRVGHRELFVAGMAAFGGASLVCAVAPSGAVLVASRAATGVAAALSVLGTIYLQSVLGWAPAANGLAFVPFSLMVIAGSALGALLLGRLGAARALTIAFVPLVVVPLVATSITADGGAAVLIAAWAVDGLGLGVAAVTATALGTAAAPSGDRGFAAGLINTATQLGTAASVALLVPLAATMAGDDPSPADTVDGLRVAFLAIAAIALAGATAALALLRRRGG
jgi:MFS family permease